MIFSARPYAPAWGREIGRSCVHLEAKIEHENEDDDEDDC